MSTMAILMLFRLLMIVQHILENRTILLNLRQFHLFVVFLLSACKFRLGLSLHPSHCAYPIKADLYLRLDLNLHSSTQKKNKIKHKIYLGFFYGSPRHYRTDVLQPSTPIHQPINYRRQMCPTTPAIVCDASTASKVRT